MSFLRFHRRFWNSIPGKFVLAIAIPLFLVCFVLFSPLWLPFVGIAISVERRRLVRADEAFHCEKCGAKLGKISLQLADDEWGRHMQQLRKDSPGVKKLRVVRLVDAICVKCRQEYHFDRAAGFVTFKAANQDYLVNLGLNSTSQIAESSSG